MSVPSSRERRFRWAGATRDGTQRRGSLIAVDSATARRQLRRAGIIVLALSDHGPARPPAAGKREITRFVQQLRGLLRLPLAGPLLRTLAAARWSRTLGTLLRAGTPLADAFDSLAQATGNPVFDRATGEIATRLLRGERLAAAMRAVGCFPTEVVQPIAVAEESGTLDAMLADIASLCERQVDERIGALTSLCEPLVVIVLGMLVGALVVAMYLPIVQLGNVV